MFWVTVVKIRIFKWSLFVDKWIYCKASFGGLIISEVQTTNLSLTNTNLISHDGSVTVGNCDTGDAVVHELDTFALMRPQNFAQQRIHDDVDGSFRRVDRHLVVFCQFRRLVLESNI